MDNPLNLDNQTERNWKNTEHRVSSFGLSDFSNKNRFLGDHLNFAHHWTDAMPSNKAQGDGPKKILELSLAKSRIEIL
jgi:hypothetical protein